MFAFLVMISSLLYVYRFAVGGVNIAAFRVVVALWVVAVAAGMLSNRITWRRETLASLALLLLLAAVNAVDLARTDDISIIGRDTAVHMVNLALVALVLTTVRDRRSLQLWFATLAWTSVVPLAISASTMIYGQLPLEALLLSHMTEMVAIKQFTIRYESTLRLAGAFYDPNFYGIYLVQVLAISVWLYPRTRYRTTLGLLIALNTAALVLTLSRTAWVGLAVLAVIALASMPPRKLMPLAIAIVLSIVIAFPLMLDSGGSMVIQDIVARFTDSASTIDRIDYLANGWRAFADSPLSGSGSEGLLEGRFNVASAHNVYLTWLAKYGILGTLPYITFLFGPLLIASANQRQDIALRRLICRIIVPLSIMYLAYDAFAFLEFQFLIFGLLWVAATLPRYGDSVGPGTVAAGAGNSS